MHVFYAMCVWSIWFLSHVHSYGTIRLVFPGPVYLNLLEQFRGTLEITHKFSLTLSFIDLSLHLLLSSLAACKTVVDLAFLIDGSGSIEYHGRGNFKLMLNFIKSIVVTLPISKTQSRVGAVLFSTSPIPLFRFGQLNTVTHIQQAINSIRYPRGRTYIGKALAFTRRYLFRGRRRRNRKRILIMLTDGISQDRVARQASLLRAKQVEIFTVGIGQALKRRQLLQIATDRNHVSVVSFRGLASLSKAIRSKICQVITPTGKYMLLSWSCLKYSVKNYKRNLSS